MVPDIKTVLGNAQQCLFGTHCMYHEFFPPPPLSERVWLPGIDPIGDICSKFEVNLSIICMSVNIELRQG